MFALCGLSTTTRNKIEQGQAKSITRESYLNEKGRPGGLLVEPGGGVEGNNEKGKLGGGFCTLAPSGGGPQSNVAGAGGGKLSPSGFFDDQADLAWCFVLRVPPLALNGEGEVVVGKVTGSGGREVTGAPPVEPKRPLLSFWGVSNSTRVLAVVEAFALRSGLSRTLNRTCFNL